MVMTYSETVDWIHAHKANGRRPSHERLLALLDNLGKPQITFPAVHVVGTNGKGSTVHFLQQITSEAGYHTGTFISPFITRFNERIAIDNKPIPDEELVALCQLVKPETEQAAFLASYGQVTEFELVTALMFVYFAQKGVDLAIIEAGIGGLEDATNVFKALAVVCPSISFDHEETLGHTLTAIAKHKVGVLDEEVPLISGRLPQPAQTVFEKQAKALSCPYYALGKQFLIRENGKSFDFTSDNEILPHLTLHMLGKHQQANAALAIMTCLILRDRYPRLTETAIRQGLTLAKWPGRAELISPHLMLDGAHNPDAIDKLVTLLKDTCYHKRVHILFAGLERKSLNHMLAKLVDYDVTVTTFDFYQARKLADYPTHLPQVPHYKDWLAQMRQSPDDFYVVTGSLYFISEVRHYLLSQKN